MTLPHCRSSPTLSIANHHASLPVAYRLYLPKEWTDEEERCRKAGVPEDIPAKSMIVALSGSAGKGRMRNAHIEVLSYWELEKLPAADAMIWLDKVVVESEGLAFREHGFGLAVKSALAERRHWLVAQHLASSRNR
jgi:hypothetical protein